MLGLAVWVAAPVVAVWLLSQQADRTALVKPEVTWVTLTPNTESVSTQIGLRLQRSAAPTIVAPELTGLIEALLVPVGQQVQNGTRILVADGVTRIGYATDRPFTRSLQRYDDGPDVESLNAMLAALGYPADQGNEFTATTAQGVHRFAADLGAGDTSVFDPNWIVFLPRADIVVASYGVLVGAPAPAPGSTLLTGASMLVGAQLIAASDVGVPVPATGSTDDSGSGASTGQSAESIQAPAGTALFVGGTEVTLDDTRQGVAGGELGLLETLIDPTADTVSAELRKPPGANEFSAPPAAVFFSAGGDSCVLRRRDSQSESVAVQVVGGTFDRSILTGPFVDGDEVALSPPEESRQCG